MESGHAVSRAGPGPLKHGNKALVNEPPWACTSHSLHEWHGPLQREGKGRAVLAEGTLYKREVEVQCDTEYRYRPQIIEWAFSRELTSERKFFVCGATWV